MNNETITTNLVIDEYTNFNSKVYFRFRINDESID